MRFAPAPVLLALAVLFASCSDSKSPSDPGDGKDGSLAPLQGTETTSLFGRIVDDTGGSVAGAEVAAGDAKTITGSDGIFSLPAAKVPKGRAVVTARKAGFFPGAKAAAPGEDGITRIQVRLMRKPTARDVPGSSASQLAVDGGAQVDFPAGAFVTATGAAYTGTARVSAAYLDPADSLFSDFFSGDNRGRSSDGRDAGLVSLGVLRLELQGSAGQPLKLAAGKPATLAYPKPAGMKAPDSIPLWHFDEALGMWKEEGHAKLQEGMYRGEVTHFSDWNLDYKGPTFRLRVTVYCDSVPMEGIKVRLWQGDALTDRKGAIRFINVPNDLGALDVKVLASDNDGVAYASPVPVDPKGESEDREVRVQLSSPCPATVRGRITGCEDKAIEGMAKLEGGGRTDYDYTLDGEFYFRSPKGVALALDAQDTAGNKAATLKLPPLADNEDRNVGDMKACGGVSGKVRDWLFPDTSGYAHSYGGVSPDGTLWAFHLTEERVRVLDTRTGATVLEFDVDRAGEPEWSTDNKRLFFLYENDFFHPGTAAFQVYDMEARPPRVLSDVKGLFWARMAQDGKTVFGAPAAARHVITVYSASDGAVLDTLRPKGWVGPEDSHEDYNFHPMPAESAFVFGTMDLKGTYHVWSIPRDTLIRTIETDVPILDAFYGYYCGFSWDGTSFYHSVSNGPLHVFDSRTGKKLGVVDSKQTGGDTTSINATLDGTHVWTNVPMSGVEVVLQIRIADNALVATLPTRKQRKGYVNYLSLSLDGKQLSADVSNGIRIWLLD